MDDEDVVLGMEFLDPVLPFRVGDGVLTITHKGSEVDIRLARDKEECMRISSLKARATTTKGRRRQRDVWFGSWAREAADRAKLHGRSKEGRHGAYRMGEVPKVGVVQRQSIERGAWYGSCARTTGRLDEGVKNLGGGECHG